MKYSFTLLVSVLLISLSIHTQAQNATDEYGSLGYNSVLGGLGISASYVNIPFHPAFVNDSSGRLEMWINPSALGVYPEVLISEGASSSVSFLFGIGTNSKLYFRIGQTEFVNTNGASIPVNQWSHVAVTWSGRPTYTVTFYLNGLATGSPVTSSASWDQNSDAIRIGTSQAFPTNFFQGEIDEVRYWSVSNASKILDNRFVGIADAAGSNTGASITSGYYYKGLISSWTFNQSGSTVYDYINGYNGTYVGSAASTQVLSGVPMPYNFAMKFPGGVNDNIRIPDNTIFQQSTDGTIDMWFKPVSFGTEQILLCKGSEFNNLSFILGVTATTGKLYFGTGSSIVINQTGTGLTLNQWNHIAVSWITSGANYQVKFYKNGNLNGMIYYIPANMPATTDRVWVGSSPIYNLPVKGWLDELRIWNPCLTEQQIKSYMFVSGKIIPVSWGILGCWNFDGNLNNSTATTGVNATLNNGSINNFCRFSAYTNDTLGGPYASTYISHSTVINRNNSPNPFPYSYFISSNSINIPDNNPAGITDSVQITINPGGMYAVEVFLSVDHTYVGDLIVTLTAPNGQIRTLLSNNGAGGKNILTFFNDNFENSPANSGYLAPWGYIKPVSTLGTFNNSPVQGKWKIKIVDNALGDAGVLKGWGLKFDYFTGAGNTNPEIPKEFKLAQNYPNPFNPVTNIKYDLPKNSLVKLVVFDALGREVETLVNQTQLAGTYESVWNATQYPSGIYFYKLTTDKFIDTKKMILLK